MKRPCAPELYDSARLALLNTLPDRARRRLNAAELTAICKSAWELAMRDEADPLVQLMKIDDPIRRLRKMVAERIAVPPDRAAVIIGEGVAKAKPHLRRGLALATYFGIRERADIPASTVELLAKEVMPAIDPVEKNMSVSAWTVDVRCGDFFLACPHRRAFRHGAFKPLRHLGKGTFRRAVHR